MAFQKHQPQRIFVEESIPRFLTEQRKVPRKQTPQTVRPLKLSVKPVAASSAPEQPASAERRNQPMHLRPVFLLKVVLFALAINAGLFWMFHHDHGTGVLVRVNNTAALDVSTKVGSLEERILTYTYRQPTR